MFACFCGCSFAYSAVRAGQAKLSFHLQTHDVPFRLLERRLGGLWILKMKRLDLGCADHPTASQKINKAIQGPLDPFRKALGRYITKIIKNQPNKSSKQTKSQQTNQPSKTKKQATKPNKPNQTKQKQLLHGSLPGRDALAVSIDSVTATCEVPWARGFAIGDCFFSMFQKQMFLSCLFGGF